MIYVDIPTESQVSLLNIQNYNQHLRWLHNTTQRLRKLNARIEIISILASKVGVLGNTPHRGSVCIIL